jgi:hypothetical protein
MSPRPANSTGTSRRSPSTSRSGVRYFACFADDEPSQGGPHHFSPKEIRDLFAKELEVLKIERTVYQGTLDVPPRALFCVMRRR